MNSFDLEERLIEYSVNIIAIANSIPYSKTGGYLSDQIMRSGISASLNYGEAQGGESRKDFVHKIKIVLKELRETNVGLKIIKNANISANYDILNKLLEETDELISIFVTSVKTAEKNMNKN